MPGVAIRRVERQRFVLLAPPGGPLRPGRPVRMEDLAELTAIVAPPGTRARELVDRARERGIAIRIGVQAAHREAVLPLVVGGAGVALVTRAWAELARGAGALVLDLEPPQYLQIFLLSRQAPLSPAAQAFLDSVSPALIGRTYKPESEPVLDAGPAATLDRVSSQPAEGTP